MKLIKLNAIDSTNEYIKKIKLFSSDSLICVYTFNQTMGKGRRANIWSSEPFMNLCVSFCYRPSNEISDDFSFKLNMLVSNKILEFLNQNKIPNLNVKWPNDILSDKKKIAGILIESSMKKNKVSDYIVGIGLNVNQFDFGDLKQASSLKKITKINYDLHKISKDFINHFSNIDENANNRKKNETSIVDSIGLQESVAQLKLLRNQAVDYLDIFDNEAYLLRELADFIIMRNR